MTNNYLNIADLSDDERAEFVRAASDPEVQQLAEQVTQIWQEIANTFTNEARILQTLLAGGDVRTSLQERLSEFKAAHHAAGILSVAARQLLSTTH